MVSRKSITVHRLTQDWRQEWDAFVKRSPQGSVYQLSGWREIFAASCGQGTHYLLAEKDSEVVGVLPMVSVRSRLLGSFLVSLPWTSYGGLCGTNLEARQALLREAIHLAREEKATHIELHSHEPTCDELCSQQTKVSMRRALPSDPEILWRSFSSKLRSQIRRPEKDGLFAKDGDLDQLDSFYSVFSHNMRDLGTPVYPRRFFQDILETFHESARICSVYAGSQPVASALLIGFKDCLAIPWASSLKEFNRLSPNMLLYWQALRYGCEAGYHWFDFGRTTPASSHYLFKAQWGAEPVPLYWHYWQAMPGPLPELNPRNPRFQLAIRVWRHLPVPLTRVIGPIIARSLP